MSNYQRYRPYRHAYRSSSQRRQLLGWGIAGLVVVILVWNGVSGSSGNKNSNTNGSGITLANSNTSTAGSPAISGPELSTQDCTTPIAFATVDQPYVSITLDTGGIVGDADKVLDKIVAEKIPVTLFVTGPWAETNAELVKRYSDAGIDVFNRGYARTSYDDLAKDKLAADIEKAETAILDATGKPTKPYLRPPFGTVKDTTLTELRRLGYCDIYWTVDALDIADGATVDDSTARVSRALRKGAIVLMHANSDIAVELLPALATEIRSKGYTLVALRDLLRSNGNTSQTSNANRTN